MTGKRRPPERSQERSDGPPPSRAKAESQAYASVFRQPPPMFRRRTGDPRSWCKPCDGEVDE